MRKKSKQDRSEMQENKNSFDKLNWFIIEQHFDANPFPYHLYLDATVNEFPKTCGTGLHHLFLYFEGNHFKQIFECKDFQDISESTAKKLWGAKYARTVAKNSRAGITGLFEIANKLSSTDLIQATNAELADLIERLIKAFTFAGAWGVIVSFAEYENSFVSKKVKEIIREKKPAINIDEVFDSIMFWPESTFVNREKEELMKIADKARELGRNSPEVEREIERHAKKFEWISFAFQGPALDKAYFEMSLNEAIKTGQTHAGFQKEQIEAKQKREKNITELRLSADEREMINALSELAFLKAYRKDGEYFINYNLERIFKEIAKRFKLSINQARFLLGPEIVQAFRTGKVDENELSKRVKQFAFIYINGKFQKVSGAEAEQFKKLIPKEEISNVTELKGEIASRGIASGPAKIILGKEDYSKFNDGDVLVSVATNPNMVTLMKRACAIVTDVGGVTCHAAIVSRELGKPCVIGTKVATRVLKDGEKIEVDANTAVIKRISK